MATKPVSLKPVPRAVAVPPTPAPTSESAVDGMTEGRELARRYLPDLVRLNAAIALSPQSEAALHTRMLAARQIVEIAGTVPQAVPEVPALAASSNGSDPS